MTADQFPAEFRPLLLLLGSLAIINGLLAHRELLRLRAQSPDLLRKAGIVNIDWWFACIRGALRLGFTEMGRDLPWFSRLLFRGIGFHYAWLACLMLSVALGILRIGS